ncbi:MAG TPA: thiamine pyrophosphate-binding protein [Polyangiaceae bacterium]|nr:thiamine pyrophosphate-binding protein [Polyangiaceae bacterium]
MKAPGSVSIHDARDEGGVVSADDSRRDTLQSDIRELRPRDDADEPEATSSLPVDAAARRLVSALLARGVDTYFGIPGGPVCALFEAIRHEPRVRLIESRHETHAAFAAALYYRASGRVPAIVVTAGPGLTNAVTGVASAYLERIPMLVITGDVAWASTGGRLAQDSGPEGIDVEAILAPITRAQVRAASARSVATQGLATLDAASNPNAPGPALFVVALDRSMASADGVHVAAPERAFAMTPGRDSVRCTAEWLAEARRPLIVLGAGCRGHERVVRDLVDAFNVPFVTTPRAKGLVSEQHPRSLRNGGMAASLWARRYTAEPVDVCLALGTDLDDTSMGPTRYLGEGGKLVHVDLDASVFARNLPTALGVTSDVGAFARALYDEVTRNGLVNPHARLALAGARTASPFDVAEPDDDARFPVAPHRLVRDVERAAGDGARFVTDIGEHMLFALHYLTASRPDSFYVQLNLGSMGSGIAGSIGVALADRERRVVCFCGDGGMQMSGAEVLVAVRERLQILYVVFNDGRYNMVHHGMRQIFGSAAPYDGPPIDFATWAKALGVPAQVVAHGGEITSGLVDSLLSDGGPALLDVRFDASVRVRGGGRVEALQRMSMLSPKREIT